MADTATFPLPADVTDEERRTLREGIARQTTLTGEDATSFRFEGTQVGQTGPVHHFQYLRLYRLQNGFLAIGHDLREGMKIVFAERADDLLGQFAEETVREFVEDELRYRGILARSVAPS